ncbi:7TM diverse intracellular signaling domain-containing protein [Wenyingzhuangia sp. IMCC45533]
MKVIQTYISLVLLVLVFTSCTQVKNEPLDFSISYIDDFDEVYHIQSISSEKMLPLLSPNIGSKNGTYWFKITLLNKSPIKHIVFDLPESNIDEVTVYQENEVLAYENIDNTHYSLKVKNQANSNVYYFKVLFRKAAYFPLSIKVFNQHQLNEKHAFFINGLYYGFATVVLILNLFFYLSLKDKTFVFYCLFLAAITLGILSYDGLLQTLLPTYLATYAPTVTHFLIVTLGYLFGYKFLNVPYYLPNYGKYGTFLLLIAVVSYLLFTLSKQYFFVAIADTISFFVLLYNWILGIIIFKKHEFAKFFVIGYCFILFSAALYIIPVDWGLPIYTTSLNNIKVGSLLEMLILTYAITYRVNILQKENEQFREEIQEFLDKIKTLEKNHSSEQQQTNLNNLITEHNLSEREAEVLLFIFKGYTNQRIADELFISLNTVKYHIRNIYQKLNIKNKNEAIDLYLTTK